MDPNQQSRRLENRIIHLEQAVQVMNARHEQSITGMNAQIERLVVLVSTLTTAMITAPVSQAIPSLMPAAPTAATDSGLLNTPIDKRPAGAEDQCATRRKPSNPRQFTPLPMPLAELYKRALAQGLIGPEILGPNSRIPISDPFANCEFHMGTPGHDTSDCPRLKHRIQDLIDGDYLILNPVPPPSMRTKPQSGHAPVSTKYAWNRNHQNHRM